MERPQVEGLHMHSPQGWDHSQQPCVLPFSEPVWFFSPGHDGKIQDLDLGMGSRVSPSGFNLAYRSASQRLGPISQPMAVFSIHRLHQGTHRLEYSWMRAGLELFWFLEDTIKINNNHILFFPACNSPSRNQFSYMYHGCS